MPERVARLSVALVVLVSSPIRSVAARAVTVAVLPLLDRLVKARSDTSPVAVAVEPESLPVTPQVTVELVVLPPPAEPIRLHPLGACPVAQPPRLVSRPRVATPHRVAVAVPLQRRLPRRTVLLALVMVLVVVVAVVLSMASSPVPVAQVVRAMSGWFG